MGVDARIYVKTNEDPSHWLVSRKIDAVGRLLGAPTDSPAYTGYRQEHLTIEGFDRIYSKHYPRAYWPIHKSALLLCTNLWTTCEVRYGSDHDADITDAFLVTPDWLAEMDAAWEASKPEWAEDVAQVVRPASELGCGCSQ